MFCFKTKKALALCLCAITLSTCFTGCKANKSEQKTTTNNTSEKFTVSGDNLSLDTTIEKVPDSIDEVVVKPYKTDVEKAKDIFLDKAEKVSYDIPDNTKEYYQDKEGNQIRVDNKEGLYFTTEFYWNLMNCVRLDPRDEKYNGDKFLKDTDLDFMSREEALNVLLDKLELLGIQLGDIEFSCYGLEHNTLEEEEYAEDVEGQEDKSVYKDKWTKDDDCYYFVIRQKKNGIVEYHKYGGIMINYEDCNSSIQAVVSKRGLESLDMECALKIENTGKKVKIIQPQAVLDIVSNKYGKIIGTEKYTINSFNLCYMSDLFNDNKVTPIYQCHMLEESDEGTRVEQLLINAETGEEVQ